MKLWLKRMNSLDGFLYTYNNASVTFIQGKKMKYFSRPSNIIAWLYTMYTQNDQCSDIVNGFDKNDLRQADFVKINEFIEYILFSEKVL